MQKHSLTYPNITLSTKETYFLLLYLRKNLARHSLKELIQKFVATLPTDNKIFYFELLDHLEQGESFSGFIQRHTTLPGHYGGILLASEETGDLISGLEQILSLMSEAAALRAKIISALIYPAIILGFCLLAFIFFVLWFIPVMAGNFSELDIPMPTTVTVLIKISNTLKANGLVVGIGLSACLSLSWIYRKKLASLLQKTVTKMPLATKIIQRWEQYQFYICLKNTLQRKPELINALTIVKAALQSEKAKTDLNKIIFTLHDGHKLSSALENTVFYNQDLQRLLLLNEESGELLAGLAAIEEHLKTTYENRLDWLKKLIEPALVVLVGVLVMFVLLLFMEPMNALINKMNF